MRRIVTVVGVAVIVCCSGVWAAEEEAVVGSSGLQASAEVAVLSAYVLRGQVINDEAVAQPYLSVSKNGVSLSAWGNYNLTDRVTGDPDFCELDLTVQYALPIKALALSVGVVEYTFPNQTSIAEEESEAGTQLHGTAAKGTREVFVQAKWPDLFVVPSVCAYYDFDEADGAYVVASLSKDIKLGEQLTLAPSVSTGYGTKKYNEYYFGVRECALNDGTVGAALTYTVNANWSASARLNYTWLWDDDIRDGAKATYFDDELVYGGVTVGYVF